MQAFSVVDGVKCGNRHSNTTTCMRIPFMYIMIPGLVVVNIEWLSMEKSLRRKLGMPASHCLCTELTS
jgi:hypothetical protein